MQVFVAGATGAIGRPLVRMLLDAGHAVTGMTRSAERAHELEASGAHAVVADALDRAAVERAVAAAAPEAVVHQLTALTGLSDFRRIDREFEPTNRLRTEGTDNLIAAARAAGAKRFVAQSFASWPYERTGGPVKTEEDPLDPNPPERIRAMLDAIRHLERATLEAEDMDGIVLRYGGFYGPGTTLADGGTQAEAVRAGKFPIVGDGGGVWSFIHVQDAAAATVAAIERGRPGIYNVTDDDPAPVREWLPVLAEAVGAKRPRRVPAWLARMLVGEHGVVMMTDIRGASNAKAKRELGWTPRYGSWREGFRNGLGAGPRAGAAPSYSR